MLSVSDNQIEALPPISSLANLDVLDLHGSNAMFSPLLR
jgi:hypothetical protein